MVNFCKSGVLSYCDQAKSPKEQEKCSHFIRATRFSRCMHLKFEIYCSCIEAQKERDGKLSDLEIAEIEESKI